MGKKPSVRGASPYHARVKPFPKIELHVHLEATVAPELLLRIARRNGVSLPAETAEELRELCRFRDFGHFIEVWIATTRALQHADDFREITVAYAAEAKRHGAVYLEAIFSPAEPVRRGAAWDEVFEGYCDGIAQAREELGVEMRLTPDIPRSFTLEEGLETARQAIHFRDRGVVGLGLGGLEAQHPPEPWAPAFELARDGGIASVPHAGEVAGPVSIRGALEALGADRIRHGVRAIEDPALVRELVERGVVLDVTPISNLRTGVYASLGDHPLPALVEAGVRCSISTDDPVLFDTDLTREYEAVVSLGLSPRSIFDAGVEGALCDDAQRALLRQVADATDWG